MLVENHGLAVGRIDAVRGSLLSGWLYSPLQDVHPLLTVGGRPAELVMWPLLRPDVQHVLGTDAETGYTFKVHHARAGERVVLSAVVGDRIVPVAERKLERALTDLRIISQLEHAAAVCRDPDSVAVTCWDAGHNAIGRAKVL